MAFVGILSQIKLLFGPLVIHPVWYILKQLFTSMSVEVMDIYLAALRLGKFLPLLSLKIPRQKNPTLPLKDRGTWKDQSPHGLLRHVFTCSSQLQVITCLSYGTSLLAVTIVFYIITKSMRAL